MFVASRSSHLLALVLECCCLSGSLYKEISSCGQQFISLLLCQLMACHERKPVINVVFHQPKIPEIEPKSNGTEIIRRKFSKIWGYLTRLSSFSEIQESAVPFATEHFRMFKPDFLAEKKAPHVQRLGRTTNEKRKNLSNRKYARIFRQMQQYKLFFNNEQEACHMAAFESHLPVKRTVPFYFPPKQLRISSRSMGIENKSKWYSDFAIIAVKTRKEGIPNFPKIFRKVCIGEAHSILYPTQKTGFFFHTTEKRPRCVLFHHNNNLFPRW